jgi:hypothetical protein
MHERGLGLTAARIAEDQDLRAMLQVLEQVELDRAVRLDRGGDEAGAGKRQRIDDDVEREDDRQQREERAEEPGDEPALARLRSFLRLRLPPSPAPSSLEHPRCWVRLA